MSAFTCPRCLKKVDTIHTCTPTDLVRKLEHEIERLRAELAEAQDKALRFELDQAGIEQREREAVELVTLRAELAECRAKHMDDLLVLSETAKAERELRAELAECKRDAERYRWVRQRLEVRMMANMRGGSAAALATRVGHAFFHSSVSPAPIKAERLDAAIDAALAAEGEK